MRAMISAAKADGEVGEDEIQRIVGRVGADGLSEEEKQFMIAELRRPLDLAAPGRRGSQRDGGGRGLCRPLLAIQLDTPAEAAYLRQLAQALVPGRRDAVPPARDHRRHRGLSNRNEPRRRMPGRGAPHSLLEPEAQLQGDLKCATLLSTTWLQAFHHLEPVDMADCGAAVSIALRMAASVPSCEVPTISTI